MRKSIFVLLVATCMAVSLPMTAAALGLDVEAKVGAGLALGSTNNPDLTGTPQVAAGGGLGVDFYFVNAGPVDMGIAAGIEYSYLATHSVWKNYGMPANDMTEDAYYNYLIFPVSLVGKVPLAQSVELVIHAGGFLGAFIGGTYKATFSNPFFPAYPGTSGNLDSSNTMGLVGGLHFAAGTDIALGGNFSLSPALQFDMGLSDIDTNNTANGTFTNTLWSLTVMVGIKYKVL
jgi:hypothetical protein